MSFDLVLWYSNSDQTDEQALEIYRSILSGNLDQLEASENVEKFYAELTTTYPVARSIKSDSQENSPYSCAIDHSNKHVIICLKSSHSYLAEKIWELGDIHGLTVYDPQTGKVFNPL